MPPEPAKRSLAILAFLVLGGALLRFHLLAHQSYWYDEAVSAALSRASFTDILTGQARDLGNPPLHLLLLKVWARAFGDGDASLRAASAAVSVASIPVFYAVAQRLAGERVALTAAAILAASPLHVYFAQETRTYALVTFLFVGGTWFLLRAVEAPAARRYWAGYAVCAFLAMYAHYFAAFGILAQIAWVLVAERRRPVVTGLYAALIAAALLYLMWLPSLLAQVTTKGNLSRGGDTWILHFLSTPLVYGVGTTLVWKDTRTTLRLVAAGLALVAFVGCAAVGVQALRTRRRELGLVLAWLGFPILLPVAISVLLFPFYNVRYVLLASPPFYLLIAAGLWRLSPVPRALAVATMATAITMSLFFYFHTLVKHDWRDAAAFVESRARPSDIAVFDADIGETPFARYASSASRRLRLLRPDDVASHPAYAGVAAPSQPARALDSELASAGRIWFVSSDPGEGTGGYYRDRFDRDFRLVDAKEFRGVEIRLYEGHAP